MFLLWLGSRYFWGSRSMLPSLRCTLDAYNAVERAIGCGSLVTYFFTSLDVLCQAFLQLLAAMLESLCRALGTSLLNSDWLPPLNLFLVVSSEALGHRSKLLL